MRFLVIRLVVATLCVLTGGCVSTGSGEAPIEAAIPTDTYDNCGASVGGLNLVTSGASGGPVRLGMTECELVKALGDPDAATPAVSGPDGRRVTLTYANPDGTGTAYLFVNNALKEIDRVEQAPAPPDQG